MIRHVSRILTYKTAIKRNFYEDQSGTYEVGSNHYSFNADKVTSVLWVRKAQEINSDISYVVKDVHYHLFVITFDNGQKEYICVPEYEDFLNKVWPEHHNDN